MGIGVKRLNKEKNRGKNRLGGRRDRLRLEWEWDPNYERATGKKFIRCVAHIGNYYVVVDRVRYGGYSYHITVANCLFGIKRQEDYEVSLEEQGHPHKSFKTRIDTQMYAEQILYKHLKRMIRDMEG